MNAENKRKLVQDILLEATGGIDVDMIVYTEDEW